MSKNKLKPPVIWTVFSIICLFNPLHYAHSQELTMWIMPNESPLSYIPKDEEIVNFLAQNPNLKNTLQELRNDHEFSRSVLGQTEILNILKRYKEKKGITVNLKVIKWQDAFMEIKNATSSKDTSSPDILQLGSTWLAYFANDLVEISKYIDENRYFKPSMDSCRIMGSEKIYAIPLNVDIRVLYYWKDIVNHPEISLERWEFFEKTCRDIQRQIDNKRLKLIAPIGFPIARDWDLLHQFAIWLWGAGGDLVKTENVGGIFPLKKMALNSKEGVEAVIFLRNLTQGIYLPELNLGELEEKFMKGEFGIIISGGWMTKRLQDKLGKDWERKIGIALPPIGPQGRFTFVGGTHLAILKSQRIKENLKGILDFLTFLYSKDVQIEYNKAIGALPGLKSAMEEYIIQNPSCQILMEAIRCGKSYPSIPEWAEIVEKEMTLNNLYSLWKHIVGQKELKVLINDLDIAATMVNNKLNPKTKWLIGSLIVILILLVLWIISSYLWKKHKRQKELETTRQETELEPATSIPDFSTPSEPKPPVLTPTPPIPPVIDPPISEKPFTVTIYLKKVPSGDDDREWCKNEEEFLKHLLNPKNVKVEIMKRAEKLSKINKGLNKDKYENQRLFFSFIAYMTQYRKLPVSPTKIEEVSRKDEEEVVEDEKPFYIFSREVGVFTRARYSQWIQDIRALFPEKEWEEILPIDKEGYRIKGLIIFKKVA